MLSMMSRMSLAISGPTASETILMHANTAGSTGGTFCFLQQQQQHLKMLLQWGPNVPKKFPSMQ